MSNPISDLEIDYINSFLDESFDKTTTYKIWLESRAKIYNDALEKEIQRLSEKVKS